MLNCISYHFDVSHFRHALSYHGAIIISMLYIIEDDEIMAECIAQACAPQQTKVFADAVSAMQSLSLEPQLPQLIFLDILLTGPDGFTFLNELISYPDTAQIPIVIISSLDFQQRDLSAYGVVGVLDKSTMYPADITQYVVKYTTVLVDSPAMPAIDDSVPLSITPAATLAPQPASAPTASQETFHVTRSLH